MRARAIFAESAMIARFDSDTGTRRSDLYFRCSGRKPRNERRNFSYFPGNSS